MSETVQLWLFGILGGGLASVFVWIYAHSVRDAKREAKLDQLTQEVGHPTVKGSILERLHRYGAKLLQMWEHLQLRDEEED